MRNKWMIVLLLAALLCAMPSASADANGERAFGGLFNQMQESYQAPEKFSLETLDALTVMNETGAPKSLTLMVYMCGSNLESSAPGSATQDIREMVSSNYDPDRVNVLVMPGGAKRWHVANFSADHTGIYMVRPDGIAEVWAADHILNMGDPETLRSFLAFGYSHCPADQYALVIWDHGGGSIGGVCHDELTGDMLSMSDLQKAMRGSPAADQALEWLGFDACLMGSAEVSVLLAPYARYMIASEETEPGTGWDYSFLKGVEEDADGAETGRRIVSSYISWYEENLPGREVTLSCIDLSGTAEFEKRMDAYFEGISEKVLAEDSAEVSRALRSVRSFGNSGESESGDSMPIGNATIYDLFDLGSLIRSLDGITKGSGKTLLDYLENEVVVVSDGTQGMETSGLTVYHPLRSKNSYPSNLRTYRSFGIFPMYVKYIESFGSRLMTTPAASYSSLLAGFRTSERALRSVISLPLSEAQRENLAEAEMITLQCSSSDPDAYHLVSVSHEVSQSGDGDLVGAVTFRNLFLTGEDGEPVEGSVPLYYLLNDAGQILIPAVLCIRDWETGETEEFHAYLVCEGAGTEPLALVSVLPYDEVSESYSERLILDLSAVEDIRFECVDRRSTRGDDGALLGFEEWEATEVSSFSWNAEENYTLRFLENRLPEESVRVAFQLTDVQSNHYLSELISMDGTGEEKTVLIYDDRDQAILLDAPSCGYFGEFGFQLAFELTNLCDREIRVEMRDTEINGVRVEGETVLYGMGPHDGLMPEEAQAMFLLLLPQRLEGLERADTIRFQLEVTDAETGEMIATIPVWGTTSVDFRDES